MAQYKWTTEKQRKSDLQKAIQAAIIFRRLSPNNKTNVIRGTDRYLRYFIPCHLPILRSIVSKSKVIIRRHLI